MQAPYYYRPGDIVKIKLYDDFHYNLWLCLINENNYCKFMCLYSSKGNFKEYHLDIGIFSATLTSESKLIKCNHPKLRKHKQLLIFMRKIGMFNVPK